VRVLIVGTNRVCHDRLRHHGHELVLFMRHGRARPADVTGPYRHVVVLSDDADLELWVDVARVHHRQAPFDAVVAYNEHTYPIVHAISEALGVPTVVDIELFGRVLDKSRMREILDKHGIPSCRYQTASGREPTLAAIARVGFPCIVKPLDGEASLGVAKIGSAADIDAALRRVGDDQIDRGVLVEEFMAGEEYSVEAISTGTRHRIVAVTRKFIDDRTFVERGHLVPAPVDAATHASIASYVTGILDVLGFHDCPSHTEIVLTAQGPRIIETHNRIGGDSIMDLVHLATGVDMYDLVARQSLGEDVTALLPDRIAPHRYAAVWFADPGGPSTNTLVEVQGVERVAGLPYVERVEVLKQPGSPQTAVAQSTDRSGLVVVVGETPHETVRRAREAIRTLRFIYVWNPADGSGEPA
jgi:biotin carboxylase